MNAPTNGNQQKINIASESNEFHLSVLPWINSRLFQSQSSFYQWIVAVGAEMENCYDTCVHDLPISCNEIPLNVNIFSKILLSAYWAIDLDVVTYT